MTVYHRYTLQLYTVYQSPVTDLFKYKCLRIVTLKLIVMWIFTAMAYYGLIFGELPGDTLTNNLLNSIMECSLMPFVIGFINHKYCNRKWLCGGLYFIVAFSIGGSAVFQYLETAYNAENLADCNAGESTYVVVAKNFTFVGRATAGAVFAILYIYTGELFPTVVRSGGVGLCGSLARIGSMVAPQVIKLRLIASWLPGSIICITTIIAGLLCVSLRDTKTKKTYADY